MSPPHEDRRPGDDQDGDHDGAGSNVPASVTQPDGLASSARSASVRLASISDRLDSGGADQLLAAQIVGNVIEDLVAMLVRLAGAS